VSGYAVSGIGGIINVQGRTTQQYFTASTTWSFAHNLGDRYVSLQAFDDAFEMMIPTTIRLVDFTSSLLLFDSASSGYAVATIGGDLPAISSSYAGYTLQVANSAPYSASWVAAANVTVTNAVSSSFAATASSADNLTVRGTLTAQTINVQTITSSIEFVTGSTRNGSLLTNTHEFTGSVLMSGSLTVGGATTLGGNTLLSYSSNTTTANAFPRLGVSNTNATQQDYNISELYVSAGNGAVNGSLLASYSSTFPTSTPSITLRNTGNSPIYFSTNGTIRQTIAGDGAITFSSTVTAGGQLITSAGQTGGYVTSTSGYVNETRTVSTNGTSYYLIKSTGTSNGSSTTTFNITGMSTTNGTYADIYAIAQKDATANAINTNVGVQINGQSMNLPTIQAGGTGANTVRCTFRVCRMESTWVIIGTPNTSYF
jgi:hypothetical protein